MTTMHNPPHPSLLLGTRAELWLGMQTAFDLWNEKQKPRPEVLPLTD